MLCTECIKAKRSHDYTRNTCESGIGDLRTNSHDEQDPRFRILDDLNSLAGLEIVVFDALAVCGDAGDGDETFVGSEEFCC